MTVAGLVEMKVVDLGLVDSDGDGCREKLLIEFVGRSSRNSQAPLAS